MLKSKDFLFCTLQPKTPTMDTLLHNGSHLVWVKDQYLYLKW